MRIFLKKYCEKNMKIDIKQDSHDKNSALIVLKDQKIHKNLFSIKENQFIKILRSNTIFLSMSI